MQLSYWIPQCKKNKKVEDLKEGGYDDSSGRGDHFEMEPEGSAAGVRVKGLRKVFSTFRGKKKNTGESRMVHFFADMY